MLIKTVTQTGLLRQEKFGYAVQIKQNCGRCNISEEKCKKIKVVNSDLCSRYQKVSIFYSTVTLFARLRGLSIGQPRLSAV